ncbi:MAG: CoA transferase [Pseudomonadota bacterium]
MDPTNKGPLHGLPVVDMTRLAAGKKLTYMLADFDAEVIKIERPGRGDDLRLFGEAESWWKVYARSKRSLSPDFKSREGPKILEKRILTAEILCETFVLGPWAGQYEATGNVPQRIGNSSDVAAARNLNPTKDCKHIAMSVSMQSMQSMWEKLAHAMGQPELISDARFVTSLSRIKNQAELDAIISKVMATGRLDGNLAYFESQGVIAGPISDIPDLIDHPFIRGRAVLQDFEAEGMRRQPMHHTFLRLSKTPCAVRAPAPKRG